MQDHGQESFLRRIRSALKRPSLQPAPGVTLALSRQAVDIEQLLATVRGRSRHDRLHLLDQLMAAGQSINLNVVALSDAAATAKAIVELVDRKTPEWGTGKRVAAWRHPLIDALDLPRLLSAAGVPVIVAEPEKPPVGAHPPAVPFHERVARAFIGVTAADFCVAQTGTLVLKTRPGQDRSVSLLPPIHVAVITLDQVLASFTELYTCLSHDPVHQVEGITGCMTFISGPSKTADIEAVMVHGAHGPKEVWLYVITGPGGRPSQPGP